MSITADCRDDVLTFVKLGGTLELAHVDRPRDQVMSARVTVLVLLA